MSEQRKPKRQRQKERRAARRQAQIEAWQARRRRRRTIALATLTGALIIGGAALAFVVSRGGDDADPAAASPTPAGATPAAVACGGDVPDAAGEEKQTYAEPEDQQLDADTTYVLRLETSCGRIDIRLAHREAPETANSIAFLARQGFFDGLTFHRVVPGFVLQGGDPAGDGTGGPGYKTTEPPPDDLRYTRGVVAMAKAGQEPEGTAGSQFFIVVAEEASQLQADCGEAGSGPACGFALLGEVVEGMDVAQQIEQLGQGDGPPSQTVYIEDAEIVEL